MALLYPDSEFRRQMQDLFGQIGGDYRDWEVRLTAKNGSERIIAWSNVSKLYPIPGWKMWAIGVDVTRRKQTEQALHDAHESLERRIAERTAELRVANEKLQARSSNVTGRNWLCVLLRPCCASRLTPWPIRSTSLTTICISHCTIRRSTR
jgi:PAS domain-containing protein